MWLGRGSNTDKTAHELLPAKYGNMFKDWPLLPLQKAQRQTYICAQQIKSPTKRAGTDTQVNQQKTRQRSQL